MKCGRRSLLISMRDRSADICRADNDAEGAAPKNALTLLEMLR